MTLAAEGLEKQASRRQESYTVIRCQDAELAKVGLEPTRLLGARF